MRIQQESLCEKHGAEKVLSLKEQISIVDDRLEARLDEILPKKMKNAGIDCWIVLAREYNEDPIYSTLVSAMEKNAARLSCLAFFLQGDQVDRLSLCRPNPGVERFHKRGWDIYRETQWEAISRVLTERDPKRIGLNFSEGFAMADGLSKELFDQLKKNIPERFHERLVSATDLSVGWLETRSERELKEYPKIYKLAENIINEAFSERVIKPGETTTTDVEWWILEKCRSLGVEAWFNPTIDLQRAGEENSRMCDVVILPGDLLHCDVGIRYLGLCTDTQRLAYVRKDGESCAPEGLTSALRMCNHFQDMVTHCFREGRTGNEILSEALEMAKKEGMEATLYTHPIGIHGHGAGPIIGLWDNQSFIPVKGEKTLEENTCYALELNNVETVEEWGNQRVTIYLEETIAFSGGAVSYIGDRQMDYILI